MCTRNRTPSQIIGYGLHLYFLGLSFRNMAKALSFLKMLCCIIHVHSITSIFVSLYSSKQVIQRYFHCHLFYHVLKLGCRYVFTKHPLYRRKCCFSHPPASIISFLFPFIIILYLKLLLLYSLHCYSWMK